LEASGSDEAAMSVAISVFDRSEASQAIMILSLASCMQETLISEVY
jgi:hypothetical protein